MLTALSVLLKRFNWTEAAGIREVDTTDGVRVVEPDLGWVLVLPDPTDAVTHLWAEGTDADTALACLTDLDFGPWALEAWPRLSDAVLAEPARGSPPSTPGTRSTRGPT